MPDQRAWCYNPPMATALNTKSLLKLSAAERGKLMQALWDSFFTDDDADVPVSKQQLAEMNRRLKELREDPSIAVSHSVMMGRLNRLRKKFRGKK